MAGTRGCSDIQYLSIYVIAQEWEKETETGMNVWLHRMCRDALVSRKDKQPFLINGGQLTRAGKIAVKWLSESVPSYLPKKLSVDLYTVKAEKYLFGAWCEDAGYPLPNFWFPERCQPTDPEKNNADASEQLRSKQKSYSTQKEKSAAAKDVIKAIKNKEVAGLRWHHLTELRRYMKKEGILKEKEGGLNKYVKNAIKKEGIEPANGKAPAF